MSTRYDNILGNKRTGADDSVSGILALLQAQ